VRPIQLLNARIVWYDVVHVLHLWLQRVPKPG
jgi:hypothetical protein